MQKLGEITLKELWYMLFSVLIPFICVGGVTFFPYHLRFPLVMTVPVIAFLISVANTKKIQINLLSVVWFAIGVIICISCLYSYDKDITLRYGLVYVSSSFILFLDYPEDIWEKVLKAINVFVIVIAVSIVVSVFINDLIAGKLWFITNPMRYQSFVTSTANEIREGSYSGLAGEKANAALTMNVGLGLLFAKFFSGTKLTKFDYAEFILVCAALILTGKRMLFLIPVAMFIIMMMVSQIKGKFVKFISIVVLAIIGVLILSAFIPQMSNLYDRFFQDSNSKYYDPLTRRGDLWNYCFMMFEENPLFGLGYATFNEYAFDHGYLRNGQKWNAFGHNCYYELLGEVGIVGTVILVGFMVFAIVMTVKYLRKKDLTQLHKILLMFSLYIQGMMFIYCLSANVFYQDGQIFLWFVAISILICVHRIYAKKKKVAVISDERMYINE